MHLNLFLKSKLAFSCVSCACLCSEWQAWLLVGERDVELSDCDALGPGLCFSFNAICALAISFSSRALTTSAFCAAFSGPCLGFCFCLFSILLAVFFIESCTAVARLPKHSGLRQWQ